MHYVEVRPKKDKWFRGLEVSIATSNAHLFDGKLNRRNQPGSLPEFIFYEFEKKGEAADYVAYLVDNHPFNYKVKYIGQ